MTPFQEMSRFQSLCQLVKQDDPSLTILMLNGAGIGNTGATLLADAISRNTHLVVLFLDHNEISASGATALAPALARHPTLEFVYLSYNHIGDSGASAIANSLTTNHSRRLRVLKMTVCNIGVEGAVQLANMLCSNTTALQKLDLDGNAIRSAGAVAISQSLQHNTTLQSLSIRYNEIQPRALDSFCNALLVKNTTLTELLLEEGDEADPEMEGLAYLLACNRAGRGQWGDTRVQAGEWPRLLSRVSSSVLFTLLQSRPDLIDKSLEPSVSEEE
jgi:NLR family CARD domain-containing protein 3